LEAWLHIFLTSADMNRQLSSQPLEPPENELPECITQEARQTLESVESNTDSSVMQLRSLVTRLALFYFYSRFINEL
jgi:hypothetical protein